MDGKLGQSHVADKYESSMIKTELHALCIISSLISCEPISRRYICKGPYLSGYLNDNEVLVAAKDGTSSIVGSFEVLQWFK